MNGSFLQMRSAVRGLFVLLTLVVSVRADVFTSVQNGDWSDTNTWGAAAAPGPGDTVTIQDGHDVTLDISASGAVGSVTLAANAARSSLSLQQDLNVAGTFQMNGNDAQSDLFLNGYRLTANYLNINDNANQAGQTIDRGAGGSVSLVDLRFGVGAGSVFAVESGDIITGNIRKEYAGGLLLNAGLDCTSVQLDRGWLNTQTNDLTLAGSLSYFNSGSTVLRAAPSVMTIGGSLGTMYRGCTFNALPGDTIAGNVVMGFSNNELAIVNMVQNDGATSGLTVEGTINFSTDNDNRLALAWDASQANGLLDWVFRSGTYSADQVRGWLASTPPRLVITATPTGVIFDENTHIFEGSDGYTYVGYSNAPVVVTDLPEIRNSDALPVHTESAQLNAELVSTGSADTVVWVFWGTSDGATNASAWDATNIFPEAQQSLGTKSTNILGLLRGDDYYYRFWASNSFGAAWSESTAHFTTAASATFTSQASGDWTTKTLWDPYGTPDGPDTVIIRGGHDVGYDAASPGVAGVLTLQDAGSSLTLGKGLALSGNCALNAGTTIDLNGQVLDVGGNLDWANGGTFIRTNGSFTVGGRFNYYPGSTFTFNPDDRVNQLWRVWGSGAIYTISTNNLAGSILDFPHPNSSSSTIYLGADAVMSGFIQQDRWQFHLQGHSLTLGGNFEHGYQSGIAATVRDPQTGTIDIGGNLRIRRNKVYPALPGDIVRGNLEITNEGGTVALTQQPGTRTGLTLDGNAGGIAFPDANDAISLAWAVDSVQTNGLLDWVLRWKGDHEAALEGYYDAGHLTITNTPAGLTFDKDFHIFYVGSDDYTYVGYSNALAAGDAPEIRTLEPLYAGTTAARFRGELVSIGAAEADTAVAVYWGTFDAETNQLALKWEHTNAIAGYPHAAGIKNEDIDVLARGTEYFYRFQASNEHGVAWAATTTNFTTMETTVFTSRVSGAWSTVSTWVPFGNPSTNDSVMIVNGDDVTVDAGSPGAVSNVTLVADAGRGSLTLEEDLAVTGTFLMNGNDGQSDLFLNGYDLTAYYLNLNDLANQAGQTIDRGLSTTGNVHLVNLRLGWGAGGTFTAIAGDTITGNIEKNYNRVLVIDTDLSFTSMNNDRGSITIGPHNVSLSGNWYNTLSTIGSTVNRTGEGGTLTIGGNLDPMYRGYTFNMLPGDTIAGNVVMGFSNNELAVLRLVQNGGATEGLTVDGTINFSTDNDNRIEAGWDGALQNGVLDWVFRSGSHSVDEVRGWVTNSPPRLVITAVPTGLVFDVSTHIFAGDGGYTYVGYRRPGGSLLIVR